MLAIQLTSRTVVYLHIEPDTHPNKGGYYCEVYEGNDKSSRMLDQFTIRREQIAGTDNRDNKARKYAFDRVRETLSRKC